VARKKSSVDVSLLAEGEESSMEETEEVRGDDEPDCLGGSFEEAGNGTACVQQVKIESDEETIEVVRNAGYATRYPQDVVVDGPATQWHLERPVTQRRLEQAGLREEAFKKLVLFKSEEARRHGASLPGRQTEQWHLEQASLREEEFKKLELDKSEEARRLGASLPGRQTKASARAYRAEIPLLGQGQVLKTVRTYKSPTHCVILCSNHCSFVHVGAQASNEGVRMKQLRKSVKKKEDALELEARADDMAKAALKSETENRALIDASKPKAKKLKLAGERKTAKAAKAEEARLAKAKIKEDKAREKAQDKDAKTAKKEEVRQAKARKAKGQWDGGAEESDDEKEGSEKEAIPCEDWVIMGHAISEVDGITPFFKVAMYGFPPEDDEKEEWCQRKDLVKDGAKALIDMYIQVHANFQPFSGLLVSKPKKAEAAPAARVVDKNDPCEHGSIKMSYKIEDHPGFCKPGQYLHDLKCGGSDCVRTFVPNLKEEKRLGLDESSRPTADKPVYVCINIDKGSGAYRQHSCKHALCNQCWTKAMLGEDADGGSDGVTGKRKRAGRGAMEYAEV
jgi:hypothetical protein